MRSILPITLLALTGSSLAFHANTEKRSVNPTGCPFANKHQTTDASSVAFDPVKQKVDVTGKHAFQPPKAGDKRVSCLLLMTDCRLCSFVYFIPQGPCPRLNVRI